MNKKEINWKFQILEIKDLEVDVKYQRKVSPLKVKNIVQKFDMNAFGCIFVSYRDGEYYIVDGQHRTTAAKQLSIDKVPCLVTDKLTEEQEAELYLQYQIARTNPTSLDRIRAKLIAGDEQTQKIIETLYKHRLKPNFEGLRNSKPVRTNRFISCMQTVELIADHGIEWLDKVLNTVVSTWSRDNGDKIDPFALNTECLHGVHIFMKKAGDNFSLNQFVKKMQNLPTDWLIRAMHANRMTHGGNKPINLARSFLVEYNKHLGRGKINMTF